MALTRQAVAAWRRRADAADCLFCKIVTGEVKADIVAESDIAIAFRDVNPQAPTHVLVIPRDHAPNVAAVAAAGDVDVADLFRLAAEVAEHRGRRRERLPAGRQHQRRRPPDRLPRAHPRARRPIDGLAARITPGTNQASALASNVTMADRGATTSTLIVVPGDQSMVVPARLQRRVAAADRALVQLRHPRPRQRDHAVRRPGRGGRLARAAVRRADRRCSSAARCSPSTPCSGRSRMLREQTDERPADVLSLNILSSRGRTIRPKTLNQKRYVDAIDDHTIVFGIGPAGTGKTYLAMAKAVQALQAKRVNRIILTRPGGRGRASGSASCPAPSTRRSTRTSGRCTTRCTTWSTPSRSRG